jgi:hypothetical protein
MGGKKILAQIGNYLFGKNVFFMFGKEKKGVNTGLTKPTFI